MSKAANRPEEPDDTSLTPQELHVLSELDSRQYGYLLLKLTCNAKKRALVVKAVKYLQCMVVQAHRQQKSQTEDQKETPTSKPISIDPKTWVKLGHFHLLLEEYNKALSAYQKFYNLHKDKHYEDPTFLYGLGMVYYHFNSYQWLYKLEMSNGNEIANLSNVR